MIKRQTKLIATVAFAFLFICTLQAQDNLGNHTATQNLNMNVREIDNIKHLDMRYGTGNALRFWSSNYYSISMGATSAYKYGPVSSYSIKNNMSNTTNRGWTWGVYNQVPVAALNTRGTMQLKENLFVMGRIGIGVTNPNYELDVCGTIRAKEVRVATGWCDYVFEDDYVLRSLEEVESFIKENKHLPDVPAGADIETNGLKLAEMQATHMLKIEELTLYIIQMNKEMIQMNKELQGIKVENETLRAEVKALGSNK